MYDCANRPIGGKMKNKILVSILCILLAGCSASATTKEEVEETVVEETTETVVEETTETQEETETVNATVQTGNTYNLCHDCPNRIMHWNDFCKIL